MKSSMIINDENEEIFNFIPSFEEIQILGEMRTHTSPSPSKSTFVTVIGKHSSRLYVSMYLSYHIDKNMMKIYNIYVCSSKKKQKNLMIRLKKVTL